MSTIFEKLWANVDDIRRVRKDNAKIEQQIDELTDDSIKQSNGYIQQVVRNLVDEKARTNVTTLQRQVILGANINTSSNYQLKVLFGRLKGNLRQKKALLTLTAALLENTEKDLKALAGTPFESLPKSSKQSLLKIKDLAQRYIKNVEAEQPIQQAIFDGIETRIREIENLRSKDNAGLFSEIKSHLWNMLIIILVASLAGILTSVLTARSVSAILRKIIDGLSEGSDQVASASGQVSSAGQSLAEGTSEQAASIENTIKAVQNGDELTRSTQESFAENTEIAGKVAELIEEIAAASNDQAQGIEEVNKAVAEMDRIIQQNAANAEETASATEEMSAQAVQMKGLVEELVMLVGGR